MMLISDAYRAQQRQMHHGQFGGIQSIAYLPMVEQIIDRYALDDLLDYGAGKGHLGVELLSRGWTGDYHPYDPGVPEFSDPPEPADFVCCIDVLEHIEPDCLQAVLDDLQRLTKRVGFISVHLRPAKKRLPDGRNAHLIIEPAEWWHEQIAARFSVMDEQISNAAVDGLPAGVLFVVEPRP